MKKILFLNVTYKNASTGRIIDNILSAPDASNVAHRVLFQIGNNADEFSYQFENRIEYYIRIAVHKFFGKQKWVNYTETKKVIQKIKEFEPDLINLHTLHHQCVDYGMLFDFLQSYGTPVVVTVHDCWVYTGGCYHYTNFGCDKFKTGCYNCCREKCFLECKPQKTAAELKEKCDFYNNTPQIYLVGVSKWICDEMRASLITNPNIFCIHNGINMSAFYPDRESPATKAMKQKLLKGRKHLLIGVADAWGEAKGLSKFSELALSLGDDYQIVLVGGAMPTQPEIDNLWYYGHTYDTKELASIYNAADMLVNLSMEESFGLVSVEAASCGTPVIGFSATANTEVIKTLDGILVEPGDYSEIITQIKLVFEENKELHCNTEAIRKEFSKEAMAAEYWKLFNKILYHTEEKSNENKI